MVPWRYSSRIWHLGILATAGWAAVAISSASGQENDMPVKFKQVVVQDTTLKQPAFTVLIPGEWQGEGRVFWRNHPQYPATGTFVANKPGTAEQISIYPQLPFVDGIRKAAAETAAIAGPDAVNFAVSNFPEGGNYMGNEVRMIMSPARYVEEIVLKRFRKDITNYKVLKIDNMPEWAKSSAVAAQAMPGLPVKTGAGRVRIEYKLDWRTIHEDFFVLLNSVEILKCQYWGSESASSVRAEAGQLDKLQAIHQTVVHSVKIDEKWFSRCMQVSQMLQDVVRLQQKQVMEISNIIRQTNDHISKTISDGY